MITPTAILEAVSSATGSGQRVAIRRVSADDVAEMRRRRQEERQPLKQIAFDFDIPPHRASRICRGVTPRPESMSDKVIAATAEAFGLTPDDVRCTKMRTAVGIVKKARRAAAVVMRESCGLTWMETAQALNRTNHATIWKLVERAKVDRLAMQGVERIRTLMAAAPPRREAA
jgi:chromosomal replication initiation ATPase DnaA